MAHLPREPRLEVIIVGGGFAGLTCAITLAHYPDIRVTVLEKTDTIERANQGFHLPPNACHALRSLRLLDKFMRIGHVGEVGMWLDYRSDTSEELLKKELWDFEPKYGAPWLYVVVLQFVRWIEIAAYRHRFIHREAAISVLLDEARALGVLIHRGIEVTAVTYNLDYPYVTLANHDTLGANVIIGSDGVRSIVRMGIYPQHPRPKTRAMVYRAVSNSTNGTEELYKEGDKYRIWMGPKAHAVVHPVCKATLLDVMVVVTDKNLNSKAPNCDPRKLLVQKFDAEGWDVTIEGIIGRAPKMTRSAVKELEELPEWSKGKITLVGDAAHSSSPYFFQREAMAIEDSVTLGKLLGLLVFNQPDETRHRNIYPLVPSVLRLYEAIRRPETSYTLAISRTMGEWFHLEPSEEGKARDPAWAARQEQKREAGEFYQELFNRSAAMTAIQGFKNLMRNGLYILPEGDFINEQRFRRWEQGRRSRR
ncbi:Fc.00g044460.m01.CDS01 [Cosmosporella sp. VM-42]